MVSGMMNTMSISSFEEPTNPIPISVTKQEREPERETFEKLNEPVMSDFPPAPRLRRMRSSRLNALRQHDAGTNV